MSEQLTKVIIDCSTNTETIVPLTQEEIEEINVRAAEFEVQEAARIAAAEALAALKASAKAKLVAGQPLTEEEATTIVL